MQRARLGREASRQGERAVRDVCRGGAGRVEEAPGPDRRQTLSRTAKPLRGGHRLNKTSSQPLGKRRSRGNRPESQSLAPRIGAARLSRRSG